MPDADTNKSNSMMITAGLLTGFAVFGAALVGITYSNTEDDIKLNEKRTLLSQLNTIIPAEKYDNDLIVDAIDLPADARYLSTAEQTQAYRARKAGKDVAVVFSATAPDGYNGPIDMLVGVYEDGSIAGVRIVSHRETPGLGDAISITHSDWILGFDGRALHNPQSAGWKVKRDGGMFDQFTGATITPRAVVKAVHNALIYFDINKTMLFANRENTRPEKNGSENTGPDNTGAGNTGKQAETPE